MFPKPQTLRKHTVSKSFHHESVVKYRANLKPENKQLNFTNAPIPIMENNIETFC